MEISLAGVASFRDAKSMGSQKLFASTLLLGVELHYKLAFFWGVPIIVCKACCNFNWATYGHPLALPTMGGGVERPVSTWATLLIFPSAIISMYF